MRRRETIQLFSTSSIDMLACGLGAVLLLWLLVFGNEGGAIEGERPRGSGEMRIRQFGEAHLRGFIVPDGYTLQSYSYRKANGFEVDDASGPVSTELLFAEKCNKAGRGARFEARYRKAGGTSEIEVRCKASNAFAKEVSIRFNDMSGAAKVGLIIHSCIANEVHYLEMQALDRRGVNEKRYVFHCSGPANEALNADRASAEDWERNFRTSLGNEIRTMCPTDAWPSHFLYRIYDCNNNSDLEFGVSFSGDGAVSLTEPDEKDPPRRLYTINDDPIRDRVVRWAEAEGCP